MKEVEFGTLFEFIRNGMNVQQDKSGAGLPITRIETISNASIDGSRVGYAGLEESNCSSWLLKPGDILFSHINSVEHLGKCAVYTGEPAKLVHGMNLLCLRPDQTKLTPQYGKFLLRSQAFRSRLSNFINKAVNQASVSIGNLKTIPVSVPSLSEQRRIAEVLDRAEALRAKRREAIALLDALSNAIFLDLFGDPIVNPKGWSMIRLQDVLSIPLRNGLSPSNTGKVVGKVLTLSAITGEKFNPAALKTSTFQSAPPSDQTVNVADFLICRGNGNIKLVGKGYFPDHSMPDVTFPDTMIAARISPERLERAFLQHIWNSNAVRRQIGTLARTTNGTFKVNQTMLEGITFIAPHPALQSEFAQRASAVEKLKAAHHASLAELDALFASLQHRAFRGEL